MYQFAYEEIIADSSAEARSQEMQAFDRANQLLEKAQKAVTPNQVVNEALSFTEELWMILIEDLAHPDNQLPENLRAQLISIGIWVIKEIDRIRRGEAKSFSAIAEINAIVRDGLN